MGPSPHLWFLDEKQRLFDQNYKSLWVPDLTCRFVHAKQHIMHQYDKSIWVPALICGFCKQNSDFTTRLIHLYGFQTSSVVLSTHNSVLSIRINSLYGSQPSSVVYASKTATFGSNLQVSKVTRLHLSFSAGNTSCLASELLVSMGPSPYVWFLDAKQRLLNRNNKSLMVPDITCCFVRAKQRD